MHQLLIECKVAIPPATRNTIFAGIEAPLKPAFKLRNCFEHLIKVGAERYDPWIYIERALAAYGVYPGTPIFQCLSQHLAEVVFTRAVLAGKVGGPVRLRILQDLMGIKVVPDVDGTPFAVLQPWNITLRADFDLDFLIGLWIGVGHPYHAQTFRINANLPLKYQIQVLRVEGASRHGTLVPAAMGADSADEDVISGFTSAGAGVGEDGTHSAMPAGAVADDDDIYGATPPRGGADEDDIYGATPPRGRADADDIYSTMNSRAGPSGDSNNTENGAPTSSVSDQDKSLVEDVV